MTDLERLKELLKGKSEGLFPAYDLASKAYYRASRGQHRDAGLLFEASARRAQATFDDGSYDERTESGLRINQALNYWARSGVQWVKAGEIERATPLLVLAIDGDWRGAGLHHDLNTVAVAWTHLVRMAGDEGLSQFKATFAQAEAACSALGVGFPWGLPYEMELAETAMDLGATAVALRIVAPLRGRKPMQRSLRAFLKGFDARSG